MAHSKTLAQLRNVKTTGLTCACCRDTGSHMFGTERRDCDRCEYHKVNNDILKQLPATLKDLVGDNQGWYKGTISEHVATMHSGGRVKFKNNGKQGVLIVRVGEK